MPLIIQESAGNLDEPLVLDRVVELRHVVQNGADAFPRLHLRRQSGVIHARRMGQLRVVVVSQDVVEAAGGWAARIDVRVGIDQGNVTDFGIQLLGERIVEHHG